MKRWVINCPDENIVKDLGARCDLSPLVLKTMVSRGYKTLDSLADFFNTPELQDPFELNDMQDAVDAINEAVDRFDLICIYGDYDADGVTATAILYDYLECLGANVTYYIPTRDEGYGLNENAIRSLCDKGVKLIVTVDNGISAIEEAKLIKELGMSLVVTDHHQPPDELPEARAVVNPHREDCVCSFHDLAGVGVALKLCAALDGGSYEAVMEQYADLAAIGTVADVVPLKGENRSIVRSGTELLKNTENRGLLKLLELNSLSGGKINSNSIAFMLSPKINAAGRFASALTALKMLISEELEAEEMAAELCELNSRRKQAEAEIINEIKAQIDENPDRLLDRVLVFAGKSWHHGVVGIVAARVAELFGKPCIIISIDGDGVARGSARSFKGFNIFKCFSYCADLLERFGGHECAGGFTVAEQNIGKLRERILAYAGGEEKMPAVELCADKMLTREDLTVGQVESLSLLEPIGAGNPKPVFAVIGARVQRVTALSQGKHTRLDIAYQSSVLTALCFGKSPQKLAVFPGDTVDMMVNLTINEYNGTKSINLMIQDIRLSGVNQQKALAALGSCESFLRGDELSPKLAGLMYPDRNDFLRVYRAIKTYISIPLDMLMCRMFTADINFAKTKICVEAFVQAGIATIDRCGGVVSLVKDAQKTDLESLEIMKRLKNVMRGGAINERK